VHSIDSGSCNAVVHKVTTFYNKIKKKERKKERKATATILTERGAIRVQHRSTLPAAGLPQDVVVEK
jgi:hypothetical protein